MLLPENTLGDRALSAFDTVFTLQDAQIQKVMRYSNNSDYSQPVEALLGVEQSEQRHRRLEQLTGISMEFQARRRQDIDFIFFIADPATGRRIKPFIDFYYAHDITKYASSRIYNGTVDEVQDRDLNDVNFPIIPFMLEDQTNSDDLESALRAQWNDSRQGISATLFALGYDSYEIVPELSKLKYFPNYRQQGLSGRLSVNEYGHVIRELPWVKFNQGKIQVTQLKGPNVSQFQEPTSP